jgi:outer membrane protein OmpA-like peptidoglycan-associated protein
MDAYGTSKASADARDAGGVLVNGGLVPAAQKYYEFVGSGIGSMYVYDATNVRLQELSLGYNIPVNKWVSWIQDLNLSFIAHNLFMFYCKSPFDPQLTASTATGFDGMDYFMLPSMRSLGFSAKITFGGSSKKEAAPAPQVIEKEIIKEIIKEVVKEVPVEVVKEVPAKTLQGIYNDDLYFVIGKAEIRPDEAFKLGKIAQIMKDNPDATIEITGSADSITGAARTNARLSEKRAQTVVNMLAKDGIPASRISYKAAVDSKPGQGAAANRVAICIVK